MGWWKKLKKWGKKKLRVPKKFKNILAKLPIAPLCKLAAKFGGAIPIIGGAISTGANLIGGAMSKFEAKYQGVKDKANAAINAGKRWVKSAEKTTGLQIDVEKHKIAITETKKKSLLDRFVAWIKSIF